MFKKNLKTIIGAIFLKGEAMKLKKSMDYTEYGGAPLLGLQKPVIKAHGSSKAKEIKNAIIQAKEYAISEIIDEVSKEIVAEDI